MSLGLVTLAHVPAAQISFNPFIICIQWVPRTYVVPATMVSVQATPPIPRRPLSVLTNVLRPSTLLLPILVTFGVTAILCNLHLLRSSRL
jgi:hypothetical protein